jgi:uncharacterized protein
MKIAVIGTGIAGLTCAHLLARRHDVTVFESNPTIGGHTATVDVDIGERRYAIDTGFVVYNDRTYPNFARLMSALNVASQSTEMSFSVRDRDSGFEYSSGSLNAFFAQRTNFVNPKFWRMLSDIRRFNSEVDADLREGRLGDDITLGRYLWQSDYGEYFVHRFIVPMGAAIWSASIESILDFPLLFVVRFFKDHGLLGIDESPQWRVLRDGSRSYLAPLVESLQQRIHVSTPVNALQRDSEGVTVVTERFGAQHFDHAVMATHSDQALALLKCASVAECSILGAIPYRESDVVLHTDHSVLPGRRLAGASWNYQLATKRRDNAVLTYNMNILQGIEAPVTFCVTQNDNGHIDNGKVLRRLRYAHPVFTVPGMAAQRRWGEINGTSRVWFAGAYWHNGFHEDGVVSALRVCSALGVEW